MTLRDKATILVYAAIVAVSLQFAIRVTRAEAALPAGALQSATEPLAFEVASVKLNTSGDRIYGVQYLPGGRVSVKNMPVSFLIVEAYNLQFQQVSPAPEADRKTLSSRYDIEATAAGGAIPAGSSTNVQREKLRLMLQTLLADRFKLTVHRDHKEQPGYAVVIGSGGPKLQKAASDAQSCADKSSDLTNPARCNVSPVTGIHGDALDLAGLTRALSGFSDRPIIDKTGLTGFYNIQTPGWVDLRTLSQPARPDGTDRGSAEDLALTDPSRPTLFTVLGALGLKLEAQTVPLEKLVIDHIEPPSEIERLRVGRHIPLAYLEKRRHTHLGNRYEQADRPRPGHP